jgi:hypothetical protein
MELNNSNLIINENYRRSVESLSNQVVHPDVIQMKISTEKNGVEKNGNVEGQVVEKTSPLTTYLETLMHLFKGNVGPGKENCKKEIFS